MSNRFNYHCREKLTTHGYSEPVSCPYCEIDELKTELNKIIKITSDAKQLIKETPDICIDDYGHTDVVRVEQCLADVLWALNEIRESSEK